MKTTRNLWPLGIIIFCSLFFAGTVGLVVMACSQKVDLVSADYYEQELKFQGQIDRVERTRQCGQPGRGRVRSRRTASPSRCRADQAGHEVVGRIELYRPSAAGLDRAVKFEPDTQRRPAPRRRRSGPGPLEGARLLDGWEAGLLPRTEGGGGRQTVE